MTSTKNLARTAGLLYLLVAIGGGFSQAVRLSATVSGDAAATAANVARGATLFHVGFVADMLDFASFLGVGLLLYALLRHVSPVVAVAMLTINAVSVAIQAMNMLTQLAAMFVAGDARYSGATLLLLQMHQQGYLIAQIFFGGYLLPLGYLVYRSGLFPKTLGVVLAAGGGGYLAGVAASWISPTFDSPAAVAFGIVGGLGELAFLLWLLIKGAQPATISREGALRWTA